VGIFVFPTTFLQKPPFHGADKSKIRFVFPQMWEVLKAEEARIRLGFICLEEQAARVKEYNPYYKAPWPDKFSLFILK